MTSLKGMGFSRGQDAVKTVLQYFQTNTAALTRLAVALAPAPPPAEDRVQNPGNGERAEGALGAAAHPGGVTFPFPSPNSSATHRACPVGATVFRDNTNSLHGSLARRVTSN